MKTKVEMKNDGRDLERFQQLFKTVVNVPKDALKKEEERQKNEKRKRSLKLLLTTSLFLRPISGFLMNSRLADYG